jgi:hypothetical protein
LDGLLEYGTAAALASKPDLVLCEEVRESGYGTLPTFASHRVQVRLPALTVAVHPTVAEELVTMREPVTS